MAQIVTRLQLNAYSFPLLSTGSGKPTVVPTNLDSVFARKELAPTPQLIYCENLLPTIEGYRSCVLNSIIAAASNPVSAAFADTYLAASADGASGWFSPAGGTNQIWKSGGAWQGTGAFGGGIKTSHANVGGQSYICWEFSRFSRVNLTPATLSRNTDTADTLIYAAETHAQIEARFKRICASGNYLIAAGDKVIYWSNPANPMDFTPSLVTGTGNAILADLKGKIVDLVQVANGFLIFTTENVISATYSGNATFPWVFRQVAGSTGLRNIGDAATGYIDNGSLVLTTDGMQIVTVEGVKPVLPEVTDFLAARLMETYNSTTGVLTTTATVADLLVSIKTVSKRYLVVSYGITSFTHALVFDSVLNRWGKVVVNHADVLPLPAAAPNSHRVICFLAADGSAVQLSLDATAGNAAGVAIIGRIKLTRTSKCTLQEVSLESPLATDVMVCRVATSYEGGTAMQPVVALTGQVSGQSRRFLSRLTGDSHNIHLTGMLNLTALTATLTQDGFR